MNGFAIQTSSERSNYALAIIHTPEGDIEREFISEPVKGYANYAYKLAYEWAKSVSN